MSKFDIKDLLRKIRVLQKALEDIVVIQSDQVTLMKDTAKEALEKVKDEKRK